MRLIFDGHLDLALYAVACNRDMTESVAQINQRETGMTDSSMRGHAVVSLPEMRRGGVVLCQATLAARADRAVQPLLCGAQRAALRRGRPERGRQLRHRP